MCCRTQSCCCFSLKSAAYIFAIVGIILSILVISGASDKLANAEESCKVEDRSCNAEELAKYKSQAGTAITNFTFHLILSIVLLIGTFRESYCLVLIYVIFLGIEVVIFVIIGVIILLAAIANLNILVFLFAAILLGWEIYTFVVLRSFAAELKGNPSGKARCCGV